MLSIILSGFFGLFMSSAITFAASKLSDKVTLAHWIVNPLLGVLGAIAANYLLGTVRTRYLGANHPTNACRFNCPSRCWKLDD
ncbi:hypothetical protein Si130_01997 [Streptococcus infantarius subsp. infantarius]|nr:hypothetical protein [Streptococcus infantarius subsp. infantarius]